MTTPDPDELVAILLDSLLEEAVLGLEGPPAAGAPQRRFISHGQPADPMGLCDGQLTTHLANLAPLAGDPKTEGCAVIPMGRMVVTLLRCVTALDDRGEPTASVLQAENRQLAVDGPALFKHLTRATVTGAWPANGLTCRSVRWRGMDPRPPLGGIAGWVITADVRLV